MRSVIKFNQLRFYASLKTGNLNSSILASRGKNKE